MQHLTEQVDISSRPPIHSNVTAARLCKLLMIITRSLFSQCRCEKKLICWQGKKKKCLYQRRVSHHLLILSFFLALQNVTGEVGEARSNVSM